MQALEERMDRLESKDFTELDQAMDQEFLKFLKSKAADLWKKAGECLTNEVTSVPKQVKKVLIKYKGDPDSYKKISSGNKKKWKKILEKCMG